MLKRSLSNQKMKICPIFLVMVLTSLSVICFTVYFRQPWLFDDVNCMEWRDLDIVDLSLNQLEQHDPKLIKAIQIKYLIPPSKEKYNFSQPQIRLKGQFGQPLVIDSMFNNTFKGGFFIEAGAFDGESLSNSIRFEVLHGWRGLLVEPNPQLFVRLLKKHRKAWILPHCFSTKITPEVVKFNLAGLFGGIINPEKDHKRNSIDQVNHASKKLTNKAISIQCFPLYSVLLALGNPTVHYMSLDIEGAEMAILRTIPFDKVDIKILQIETNHLGKVFEGNHTDLTELLTRAGYYHFQKLKIDDIWVKNGFTVYKDGSILEPKNY